MNSQQGPILVLSSLLKGILTLRQQGVPIKAVNDSLHDTPAILGADLQKMTKMFFSPGG